MRLGSQERIFVTGTTFGPRSITVFIQEPPNLLHSIGFLRCPQLTVIVCLNVPRKLFVWPVKWDTFARTRRPCFLAWSVSYHRATPVCPVAVSFLCVVCPP